MNSQNELAEFYDKLERHDWKYYFSDDPKSYKRAQANETALSEEAHKKNGPFLILYRAYKDWSKSNGSLIKPSRPGGPKQEVKDDSLF